MKTFVNALILVLWGLSNIGQAQVGRALRYCEVTVMGENRNRSVTGAVNVECGIYEPQHSDPFGNWGVSSSMGGLRNTDQFRGWSWQDGPRNKKQWNSCTTAMVKFHAPHTRFYSPPTFRRQDSPDTVTHGKYRYRANAARCPNLWSNPPFQGCSGLNRNDLTSSGNYMSLYELDWDGDDLVTTLYFPTTSLPLENCNYEGCSSQQSQWLNPTSSTRPSTGVSAQMRLSVKAKKKDTCSPTPRRR